MTGAGLRAWRAARGLSQAQAAADLGVSVRALASYEKAPTVPKVVALAVAGRNAGWTGDESDVHLR